MTTQTLYKDVVKLVSAGDFKGAFGLYKSRSKGANNDVNVERASYAIFGRPNSPYFNKAFAMGALDKLIKMDDSWAVSEKGRCLLFGLLGPVQTYEAENLFVKVKDKEPMAAFLLATIYSDGLHITDTGEKSFDLDEALKLYKGLLDKDTRYKNPAILGYCKIMLSKGGMSHVEKSNVFKHLSLLNEEGVDGAYPVYLSFLLLEAEREFIEHAVTHGTGQYSVPGAYNVAKKHFADLISIFNKK